MVRLSQLTDIIHINIFPEKENDTWLFPLSAYTKLISLLQDSDIPVKPIPPQILKLFTKTQTLERTQNTDFSGIPPLLMVA